VKQRIEGTEYAVRSAGSRKVKRKSKSYFKEGSSVTFFNTKCWWKYFTDTCDNYV